VVVVSQWQNRVFGEANTKNACLHRRQLTLLLHILSTRPFTMLHRLLPHTLPLSFRYDVGLGSTRLSTGLFLDQRPQRAWLAHGHACGYGSTGSTSPSKNSKGGDGGGGGGAAGLSVLNLFAHAGGYSVAAAVGGAARTVRHR